MRQAGIIAAAGLVALESMVERLAEDHRNARSLAEGLTTIPGIVTDLSSQHTNMVYFCLEPDLPFSLDHLRTHLAGQGLLVGGGPDRIRMVTHAWVNEENVHQAIKIIRESMSIL